MADNAPLLLDVTRLIWRRWKGRLPTGIDRVALAYLEHFGPRAQAVVQHDRFRRILDSSASQQLFALLASPGRSFKRKLVAGLLRNVAHLKAEGRGRLYLNVGHTGLNAAGFRRWAQNADVRPIYLVHDLIPITHPQFARPGEDLRHRERMKTALSTGAGIIGNSRATLDELTDFAGAEGLRMPPSIVAKLGIDVPQTPTHPNQPADPTFVSLGTIEARKNHQLLLDIWSKLSVKRGDHAPRLLIIGQRGWEADEVFRRLDQDQSLRGFVVELGRCSDEEIATHLRSARALLFPSFAEGYGLPLVEALASGLPAIASDLPVFRELCDGIPDYLDPQDEAGWEAAILDYARPDSIRRQEQVERMQGFVAPSWADHFAAVEAWLENFG